MSPRTRGDRRSLGTIALLAGAVGLAACGPTDQDRRTVQEWLECEPCDRGELDAVLDISGLRAIPRLAGALRGPTQTRLDALQRRLGRAWSLAGTGGTPADSAAYVDRYTRGYVTQIRTRATTALGALGRAGGRPIASWRARNELQEALDLDQNGSVPLEPQVRGLIRRELTFALYSPFLGGVSATSVTFLDTVEVTPPAGDVWGADATVTLEGAPFPADVLVSTSPASMRFVAAGLVGDYAVLVDDGSSDPTRSPLRISAFAYEPHDETDAPDLAASPLPQTHLLGLTGRAESPGGDVLEGEPADFYRIVSTAASPDFTARVSWAGDARIAVGWQECTTPGPGAANEASGRVVDEQGVPIPGALVRVIGQPTVVQTGGSGEFTVPGSGGSTVQVEVSQPGRRAAIRTLPTGTIGHVIQIAPRWVVPDSPLETTITIPSSDCRFLKIVKLDTGWGPTVVRLEVRGGPGDAVATATLVPSNQTVSVGTDLQPTLRLLDADGDLLVGRTVTWTSSDATVATVNALGLVRAVGPGTVEITAISDNATSTLSLTVTP